MGGGTDLRFQEEALKRVPGGGSGRGFQEGVPGGSTGMEYQEEVLNRVLGGGIRREVLRVGFQERVPEKG